MIKAVLLDLDNTLLSNPDRQFAIAFMKAFDDHFKARLDIDNLAQTFRKGIQLSGQSRDTIQTNTDVMLQLLSDETGATTEQVQNIWQSFYETTYLSLRQYAAPIENNISLIESLLQQNIAVAIATNPIYPKIAIYERLKWAGLVSYIEQFTFITHSDNMHYAKPHPAYYAEVIARIGIEPDEALMIGDSVRNDIQPANQMGIPTIHFTESDTLSKINEHVQQINWQAQYFSEPLLPNMIFPQYEGNLGALYGLLSEVKEHQWIQRPDPDEWSILQIVSHLQISEREIQRHRLQMILENDNPFITSPTPPGSELKACHSDGFYIADQFRLERMKTMALLENLTDAQWLRPARHSIFGMTTLLEMAHFTAQHDRLHINQLCQTLGRCN